MDNDDDVFEAHKPEKSIHLRYFGIDEGVIYIVIRKGNEIIRFNKAVRMLGGCIDNNRRWS